MPRESILQLCELFSRHESGIDETTSFMGEGNGTTISSNLSVSNNDPNEIRRASLRYWQDDNQVKNEEIKHFQCLEQTLKAKIILN
jgi:hypothetical protein